MGPRLNSRTNIKKLSVHSSNSEIYFYTSLHLGRVEPQSQIHCSAWHTVPLDFKGRMVRIVRICHMSLSLHVHFPFASFAFLCFSLLGSNRSNRPLSILHPILFEVYDIMVTASFSRATIRAIRHRSDSLVIQWPRFCSVSPTSAGSFSSKDLQALNISSQALGTHSAFFTKDSAECWCEETKNNVGARSKGLEVI